MNPLLFVIARADHTDLPNARIRHREYDRIVRIGIHLNCLAVSTRPWLHASRIRTARRRVLPSYQDRILRYHWFIQPWIPADISPMGGLGGPYRPQPSGSRSVFCTQNASDQSSGAPHLGPGRFADERRMPSRVISSIQQHRVQAFRVVVFL